MPVNYDMYPIYYADTPTTNAVTATHMTLDDITGTLPNIVMPTTTDSWITNASGWSGYQKRTLLNKDLEKLARKIYRIFSEHMKVDITEAEFMELLEESTDE